MPGFGEPTTPILGENSKDETEGKTKGESVSSPLSENDSEKISDEAKINEWLKDNDIKPGDNIEIPGRQFGKVLRITNEEGGTVIHLRTPAGLSDLHTFQLVPFLDTIIKVENKEMTDNEKIVEEWIKKNEIKEGTKLDWNGMDTLVTEVDFSERVFSYEIIEAGHEEKKTVTFEKLGEGINFLNNFTKVKESE